MRDLRRKHFGRQCLFDDLVPLWIPGHPSEFDFLLIDRGRRGWFGRLRTRSCGHPHEKYETHDERCLQRRDTHVYRPRLPRPAASAALGVTPPCALSSPSFARCVPFSEMLPQFFSLWLRLQPEMAIPAWAVLQGDGGHGSAAGCEQLLLPSAAERLYLFGARPQGMPESFSSSWPESRRSIPVQAVQFWPLAGNSWTAMMSGGLKRVCQPNANTADTNAPIGRAAS